MKRPAIAAFACIFFGAMASAYLSLPIFVLLQGALLAAIVLFLKCSKKGILFIFSALCLLSFIRGEALDQKKIKILEAFPEGEVCNEIGIVKGVQETEKGITAEMFIERAGSRAIIYFSNPLSIEPGDKLEVSGKIRHFKPPNNPGGFDARTYYHTKKVFIAIDRGKVEKVLAQDSNFTKLISKTKKILENQVYQILPREEANLLSTMLVGSKHALSDEVKDAYQVAGISHLLSISGLHVSILGMGTLQLLKKIIKNQQIGGIIAISLLWIYLFLTGASISTLRAVWMLSFMICAGFFSEKYDAISALFVSAILILFINPFAYQDMGFLLSFSAVAGMLYITPALNRRYNQEGNEIKSLLYSTIGASALSYPIVLWFFYGLPFYGLFTNLLIVPAMSVAVLLGAIAVIFSFISSSVGALLAGSVYFIFKYTQMLCDLVMRLPFHEICLGRPHFICIGAYYTYLILWLKNSHKYILKVMKPICLLCIFVLSIHRFVTFQCTFLDVGQGDAAVIEYRNKVYLIDGGGQLSNKEKLGKNTGSYVVMPYLAYKGVDKIKGIFVSHSDFDHIYGIIEVIQKVETEFLVLPKPYEKERDELLEMLLKIAEEKGIKVYYFHENHFYQDQDMIIQALLPKDGKYFRDNNMNSMVLLLKYHDFTALFTGDIPMSQENRVDASTIKDIDLLKVPHHGSSTSSSEEFIRLAGPKAAILSYGKNNSFGHPSNEVVERLIRNQSHLYHTPADGAVFVKIKKNSFHIKTYGSQREEIYPCKN